MENITDIQDVQAQEPMKQEPPVKKLWKGLVSDGKYTKSFDEFAKQYSTPESISKLYKGLSEDGDYTKSIDDFQNQYFSDLKKKEATTPTTSNLQTSSKTTPSVVETPSISEKEIPQVDLGGGLKTDNTTYDNISEDDYKNSSVFDKMNMLDELKNQGTWVSGGNTGGGGGSFSMSADASLKANKIAKDIQDSGIDTDKLKEYTSGINLNDDQKKEIDALLKTNPSDAYRTLANNQWKLPIRDALKKNIDEANSNGDRNLANNLIDKLNFTYDYSKAGSYNDVRNNIRTLVPIIRDNTDNPDKLVGRLGEEASIAYGSELVKNPGVVQTDETKAANLNDYQVAALNYFQDLDPSKYEAYKGVLLKSNDPTLNMTPDEKTKFLLADKGLHNDSYTKIKVGEQTRLKQLEEMGISLKYNALNEMYSDALSNNDVEKANSIKSQIDNLKEQSKNIDSKYPLLKELNSKLATDEVLGNDSNPIARFFNKLNEVGSNTVGSIGNMASSLNPFKNKQEEYQRLSGVLGNTKINEVETNLPQSSQLIKTKELVYDDAKFGAEIDAIKNSKLSDSEKRIKTEKLFADNVDKWHFKGIDPKSNLSVKSILYAFTDFGAEIAPYVLVSSITGGGASGSALQKFAGEFAGGMTTMYNDELSNAIERGDPNPQMSAFRSTAINGFAMAGAGTASEIRQLASKSKNPLVRNLISNLDDESILKALRYDKKNVSAFRNVVNVAKNLANNTTESFKSAAKVTSAITAGQKLNQYIDNGEVDLSDVPKELLVGTLKFTLFGSVLGLGKVFKEPNDIQKLSIYEAGKNPDEFIKSLDSKYADGGLTKEEYIGLKKNVETAKKVYESTPMINAKGKPLSDSDARELMFLKYQEADVEKMMGSNISKDLNTKLEERLSRIQDNIDKVYKGTYIPNVLLDGKKKSTDEHGDTDTYIINGENVSKEDFQKSVSNKTPAEYEYNGEDENTKQSLIDLGGNYEKGTTELSFGEKAHDIPSAPIEKSNVGSDVGGDVVYPKPFKATDSDALIHYGKVGDKRGKVGEPLEVLEEIPIDKLTADPLADINPDNVKKYSELPTEIPPIEVHRDGNENMVYDGNTRLLAAKKRGQNTIKAWVSTVGKDGTFIEVKKSEQSLPTQEVKGKVVGSGVVETKQQIENFGVNKEDVEPVHSVISQVFDGLKKAGLTAAKTVGDWVGIGKGEEKSYSLKINADKSKRKLKLYHSSTNIISGDFRMSGKNNSWGVFFSPKTKYSQGFGDMTYNVTVEPKNTLVLQDKEAMQNPFFNITKEQYDKYVKDGYDSIAWYRGGELTEFIALTNDIIKNKDLKYGEKISNRTYKIDTSKLEPITPEIKASVEGGQPLFKDAEAQYRIESGKNIVEAIKDFNGSPRATVAITHEIMHPTVVAIIDGAKEGNEVGAKHTETIVSEFNKVVREKNNNLKIVQDATENEYANSKLTKQDNPIQEPGIKAIESKAESNDKAELNEVIEQVDAKINAATDVSTVPLKFISTDEARFQNRNELNKQVVRDIAENWSDANQDPIHVWTDPKNGKTYVLSGHHRYYGAKEAGRESVKIVDRTNDFTEAEAIKFAKEEANANRSMESSIERAKALREKIKRGDSKEEINKFLEREGKNKTFVQNVAALNPKGKAMQMLEQFGNAGDRQTQKETEQRADWIGEARRTINGLTDAHENELFDFLFDKDASKRVTTKADLLQKVRSVVKPLEPNEPLNIARFKQKTTGEAAYDETVNNKKAEIADRQEKINSINDRFSNPQNKDYIPTDSKDYATARKIADEKISTLESERKLLQKQLEDIYRNKGSYTGATSSGTLFKDGSEIPFEKEITAEDLIKWNDDFKAGKTNEQYRAVQEFISESWEKYHTEGSKGFSEAFQKVLDQITKAFQSVYKSLTGKQLTPELRKMFDEILGKEQSLPTQEVKQPLSKEQPTETSTPINPPITPNVEETGGEGNGVGISHESLTKIANRLGIKEPEPGVRLSGDEIVDIGRKLLDAGADPLKMAEDFKNDKSKNVNTPMISLARAYWEKLVKEADSISDKNSKEYKDIKDKAQKWQDEVLKPMATASSEHLFSFSGETDLETGSFTATTNAFEKVKGTTATNAEKETISKLTEVNNDLSKKVDELEKKLIEETDKHIGDNTKEKNKYERKARKLADKIMKSKSPSWLKIDDGNIQKKGIGEDAVKKLLADATINMGKLLDRGVEFSEAVKEAVKDLVKLVGEDKRNEIEAGFTKDYKDEFKDNAVDNEKKLNELISMFADKSGNKFTTEESRALWDYAKSKYLENGVKYNDMIAGVANDLGLTWRQVSEAITSPKVKPISDEMYIRQGKLRMAQIKTKDYVEKANRGILGKAYYAVSDLFRGIAVFAHGHIFIGTHAGMTIFDIPRASKTFKAFFNGIRFAYGNTAKYEKSMLELKNRKKFLLAQRSGLQNDPNESNTDDYQRSSKWMAKLLGKIGLTGVKGFNAIKILRQDLWESHYNKLTDAEKTDPLVLKKISELVNNATGATNIKLPKWTKEIAFAANMETARWEKLTSNPFKASKTALNVLSDMVTKKKSVTDSEKVFAKIWASRVGWEVATYASALIANAALQNILNPNNPVNMTNPSKSDFMKFKFGETDINPTSGMLGAMSFVGGLGQVARGDQKILRGDTRLQAAGKNTFAYLRGKLSPLPATLVDIGTQSDFGDNPLPFSSDKPRTGKHKLSWAEYAFEKAPIPIADAAKNVYAGMIENGMSENQANLWLKGLIAFAEAGSTGFRFSESHVKEVGIKDENSEEYKFLEERGAGIKPYSIENLKPIDTSGKPIEVTPSLYKEFLEKRREYFTKEVSDLINGKKYFQEGTQEVTDNEKNKMTIPSWQKATKEEVDNITPDELNAFLMSATSRADDKAIYDVFKGEQAPKARGNRKFE